MDDWNDNRIRDRLQIQEILYRYCRAIDRIDTALLADLFHPDAMIYKGETGIPIAEFVPDFAIRHARVPQTSHMITSFLIEFLREDRAFVESWGLAVERVTNGTDLVDYTYRVRYADVFERRDGRWRMTERSYLIDHVMSAVVDPSFAPATGIGLLGERNCDDPAMRMRRKLGLT